MHYSLRSLEALKVIITLNSQLSTFNYQLSITKKALLRIRARQGFLT